MVIYLTKQKLLSHQEEPLQTDVKPSYLTVSFNMVHTLQKVYQKS